jgi:general secretion pathway protein D
LDVVVVGVNDLGAFEFELLYDPAVVWVTDVQMGDLLGDTDRTVVSLGPEIDNETGLVAYAGFSFGEPDGPDGKGRLATIICQAHGAGTTGVELANVQLVDTQAGPLTPLTTLDGSVTVGTP